MIESDIFSNIEDENPLQAKAYLSKCKQYTAKFNAISHSFQTDVPLDDDC